MAEPKPKGSGVIFLVVFICSFRWDLSKIPPYLLFKGCSLQPQSFWLGEFAEYRQAGTIGRLVKAQSIL